MGKTADNEAIKLRATWFNNMSIAISAGGSVLPYLATFQQSDEYGAIVARLLEGAIGLNAIGLNEAKKLIELGVAMLGAFALALCFRVVSNREIGRLQD